MRRDGKADVAVDSVPVVTTTGVPRTGVFLYGTLRHDVPHSQFHYFAGAARFGGRAWLRGQLFLVDGYPALTVGPGADGVVHGNLYEVWASAWQWRQVDRYEDAHVESKPRLYRRASVTVHAGQGSVRAETYLYCPSTMGHYRIAGGDYAAWLAGR